MATDAVSIPGGSCLSTTYQTIHQVSMVYPPTIDCSPPIWDAKFSSAKAAVSVDRTAAKYGRKED